MVSLASLSPGCLLCFDRANDFYFIFFFFSCLSFSLSLSFLSVSLCVSLLLLEGNGKTPAWPPGVVPSLSFKLLANSLNGGGGAFSRVPLLSLFQTLSL